MDRKKRNILNNIGYKEYKNKIDAFKKACELKQIYGIKFCLKRKTYQKTICVKNRVKTIYPEVYVLC